MRRFETHDGKPVLVGFEPFRRPRADDLALITFHLHRLRQTRPVQPRIVEQESTLKSFPKLKTAARFGRHDRFRMRLADERGIAIAGGEMPLAEKRRAVFPLSHRM